MNIEKIQPLYGQYESEQHDTFEVDLGEYGTITLRKYLREPVKATLVELISDVICQGSWYNPSFLTPVMYSTYAFFAVVGDEDRKSLKLSDEFIENVFYVYYAIDKIGLIPAAIRANPEVEDILCEVSEAVHLKIENTLARSNAELAGGAATAATQTLEELRETLVNANAAICAIKEHVDVNAKKLSKHLTKKNIDAFWDSLGQKLNNELAAVTAQQNATK